MKQFTHFDLSDDILHDIKGMGFETPTPIQQEALSPALAGRDVIGLAQTGTGKTAAFGLPIVQKCANSIEMRAMILAPTRELARQIVKELESYGASSGIRTALIIGGVDKEKDFEALSSWPNVVVATPGRLIDHIYSGSIVTSEIEILAVDEADRMYDMGFMPQIKKIIQALPKKRQTLMFSATMPKAVEKLARQHLQSPERIKIGHTAPPKRAEQQIYHVNKKKKLPLLYDLLDDSNGQVLVFARTKRTVDYLTRRVKSKRYNATRLHGDRGQSQRETAMDGFRNGKYRIMIATNIAARGIDVAQIEHVINYDFPRHAEDYVHRIGRTARVAEEGLASSFATRKDRKFVHRVEELISSKIPVVNNGTNGR